MVRNILAGKYEILRQIGAGGMGVVYEARCVTDDARVAVKVLPAFMVMKDDSRLARFHREARTTASIDSDHVARILETGEDPDTNEAFMVMELLQGEDLERLLSRAPRLDPAIAVNIVGQVCTGLAAAHATRIIHRDIKPANLFLARGEDGGITVKILDFGIAKTKAEPGADTTGMTRSGSMLGSPLYMSPEQARGIKEIDFRTDVWSLGVVLYRALCGTAPHEGISAFGDLIMAICSRAPEPVQARAPWVSPEIGAVVHRASPTPPRPPGGGGPRRSRTPRLPARRPSSGPLRRAFPPSRCSPGPCSRFPRASAPSRPRIRSPRPGAARAPARTTFLRTACSAAVWPW
ncbi:serine/threonine-protein kinase [Polyangium sp. 15x6]|uniref:serine/threonine-protein kinase n=1 Tax=Polyangium sp. 15x6 TaxID=3042687 RepID=UPI002499ADA0|nr:serine/threonine-protein kinase [Polyangium sp. 15x6]MDI3287736.1 serine/threonine-protein kinase [Polyangium sp. 15x6]